MLYETIEIISKTALSKVTFEILVVNAAMVMLGKNWLQYNSSIFFSACGVLLKVEEPMIH